MAFCDFGLYFKLSMPVTLMDDQIIEKYGNRLRVRVCGMCWKGGELLMANHALTTGSDFWAPVGGGVEFGESVLETLVREFKEEAGIVVQPGPFLFGCEFISSPLHAIELFFEVTHQSGTLITGKDPESSDDQQVLKEVRFMSYQNLMAINPDKRHGIFRLAGTPNELKNLSGFYII
jgi:8-oxo-dGTP diphosphatase